MSNSAWVLTSEYNQYDQYGEYFVSIFPDKPDRDRLKAIVGLTRKVGRHMLDEVVDNLLDNGGGRLRYEDVWFNLNEVEYYSKDYV